MDVTIWHYCIFQLDSETPRNMLKCGLPSAVSDNDLSLSNNRNAILSPTSSILALVLSHIRKQSYTVNTCRVMNSNCYTCPVWKVYTRSSAAGYE